MSRTRAAASSLAFACLLHFQRGLQSGSRGRSRICLPEPDAPGEGTTFGEIPLTAVGAPARPIAARGTAVPPPRAKTFRPPRKARGRREQSEPRVPRRPPKRDRRRPLRPPVPCRPDPSPAAAAPGQLRASSPTVAVPGGARLEGARSGFSRALIFHRLCLCLPVPVGKGTAGPNRSPHLAPYGEPSGKQDPGATGRPKEAGGGGAGGVCRAGKRILSLGAQRDPRGTCRARGVSVREGGLAGRAGGRIGAPGARVGSCCSRVKSGRLPVHRQDPRLPDSLPGPSRPSSALLGTMPRGGWSNEGCRDSIPTGSPCPWALLCKVLELLSTLLFLCSGAGRNFVPDPRGTKDSQAPQCIMIKWEDWAREEGF
ncbi:translation initiation factor IF-2-like [Corvus kubaryi]|uniref:translation initiation factor IF-2-like n=1 Tax=Corvus kubaryi TaxID=68294 RepID=UPI001C0423DF|nr:translation initiation factor IF-2-like [Corvus kubaryi]